MGVPLSNSKGIDFSLGIDSLIENLKSILFIQQGIVPAIISWIIILLFLYSFFSLLYGTWKLKRSITFVTNNMKKIEVKRNWASDEESFKKLNDIFKNKKCKNFKHYWEEFVECIVKEEKRDDEKVYHVNTEPASNFFNFNTIVVQYEGWFAISPFSFFESVPTILTGLGILGTFVGVTQGLPNTSDFEQHLPEFLGGMKGAFITSILGLSLGIFFTALEKYKFSRLERKVNGIAFQIDLAFRRKTQQGFLEKIEEYNRKQYDATRKLAMEIGQEIVKGITGGGINTVEISDSVKESVSTGFERLAEILHGLSDTQKEFVDSANEIHEKYREISLSVTNINKAAEACSSTLEAGSLGFSNSADKLTNANKVLIETATEATKMIIEQKGSNEAITKATSSANEALNQLVKVNTQFLGEYQKVFSEFANHVDQYNETNTQTLEKNLKMFDQELGGGINRWRDNINSLKSLLDEMMPAVDDFRQNIVQFNEIMSNKNVVESNESTS